MLKKYIKYFAFIIYYYTFTYSWTNYVMNIMPVNRQPHVFFDGMNSP